MKNQFLILSIVSLLCFTSCYTEFTCNCYVRDSSGNLITYTSERLEGNKNDLQSLCEAGEGEVTIQGETTTTICTLNPGNF